MNHFPAADFLILGTVMGRDFILSKLGLLVSKMMSH